MSLDTSLAPHGIVLDLDNTDGVIGPTLENVSCLMNFVHHDVILENVIIIFAIFIIEIASCK